MPPRNRIDRQQVIEQALTLVRQKGEGELNARAVAAALGCSTQPLFSHFATMEALRSAVIEEGYRLFSRRMEQEMAQGIYPPYKASGMAYIRFAGEERELFRLLFMRDRQEEPEQEDTISPPLYGRIQEDCGVDEETARLLHLEMWALVHGIAVMAATGFFQPEEATISRMLTHVFTALKERLGEKE